jgi:Flp pilus assembly protein TadD
MSGPVKPDSPPGLPASGGTVFLAGAVIVCATLAAYANSFSVPFIFDDWSAIVHNPTIRHLLPLSDVLSPPRTSGMTVNGRPLLNFSLALNYAAGGLEVRGYHAVNLAIHVLAGLALFGIVRRSLLQPRLRERFGAASLPVALCAALLWTLHPLQTEAVTYVAQRAESLLGLCYLLTLYAFIRGTAARRPWGWYALSLLFCALGMTAKEVMVSAPLMVLLYDRTFIAGSFARAWRERGPLYAGLGGTWLLLGVLALGNGGRGGTAGFGIGIPWTEYALTQFPAIVHYLVLAVWPHPLVLDYGGPVLEHDPGRIVPAALIVLALVAATVAGLRRRPVLGLLGCWFFGILAPTSSIVPLADTTFEHRMYLPLAAVVVSIATGMYLATGRKGLWLLLALAAAAGILTASRNENYRSELAIWSDTVAKRPDNARARVNLGIALVEAGRISEAVPHYEAALRMQPENAVAHLNLCNALTRLGRPSEAVGHGEAAVRLDPHNVDAKYNLGLALVAAGRTGDAVPYYEDALRAQPDAADVRAALGNALRLLGDAEVKRQNWDAAIDRYRQALALVPDDFSARFYLANSLLMAGQVDPAVDEYRKALSLHPNDPAVQQNLAQALEWQRSSRARP